MESPGRRGMGNQEGRTVAHRLQQGALLALLLAVGWTMALAGQARAADCGCRNVGAYKNPAATGPAGGATSPNRTYELTATSGSNFVDLTIRRGTTTVFTTRVPAGGTSGAGAGWGFSPDDHRFVYHYTRNGVHNVTLHDLQANRSVWSTAVATGVSRLSFSPHGKYLLYTWLDGTSFANMNVVNAVTGDERYQTGFRFSSPPGSRGDRFGVVGFGFSSDADDRSFTYAYVSGQSTVSWNLVNLQAGRTVLSENIIAISAFWQFSPCGDVIALAEQTSQSQVQVRLIRTSDGGTVPRSERIVPVGSLAFSSTLESHTVVVTAGTSREDYRLADNTADDACPGTALSSLALSSSTVTAGGQVTATMVLNGTASAPVAVTVASSDAAAAPVTSPQRVDAQTDRKTFTITAGSVSATRRVTITASAGGVTKTATLTVNPTSTGGGGRTVSGLALNPSSVVGGGTANGTVTLSGTGGTTSVTLTSSNPAVAPVTSPLPVGSSSPSGTFAIGTSPVTARTEVTITATAGGSSRTATLVITPAPTERSNAVVNDPGCLANVLQRNDDGSTPPVPLPFPVNYFGTSYGSLYVNNNGNVTFRQPLGTYTPFRLTASTPPIIAPFFADVDTRATGSNPVTYSYGGVTFAGRPAFCVNWVNVGYYNSHTDKLNSFQLLLVDRSDINPGDFDIVMNYDGIQWETGDASGGRGGLGGTSAGAGYSAGTGDAAQFYEFPGSLENGAFLDGNAATGLARTSRNSLATGRHVFDVRNGSAPAGGSVRGTVTDNASPPNALAGAPVQVCRTGGGACVFVTVTGAGGQYHATGIPEGDYEVTAFPPAGSSLARGTAGPIHVAPGTTVVQDVVLSGPRGIPPGTTLTPSSSGAGGVPVVYYGNPLALTTTGCAGGTATYQVTRSGTTIAGGAMAEGPAGTYSATIPPLRPNTGQAAITVNIDCPAGTPDQTREFDVYIDPSGLVRTVGGDPVVDALVTLYRSDSPSGPFEVVPSGSTVMSPTNRQNPDLTDATGHFGWDVIAGYYRVRAEKEGCTSPSGDPFVETAVLTIPPPVTDLDLRLDCPAVDTVAPTATAAASPSPNGNGWNQGPVTVALSAADNDGGTGIRSITYVLTGAEERFEVVEAATASASVAARGETLLSYFATDNAGNSGAPQTIVVQIDDTAPVVLCEPADGAWHPDDVRVSCDAGDTVSGLAQFGDGSFFLATNVAADTETDNAATGSRRVCDLAGNCSTAGPVEGNKVDRKAPGIAVSAPRDQTYVLNQAVAAGYSCTDGGSGVGVCAGPVPSGGRIDTGSVGGRDFTVNAADVVENRSSRTVSYKVSYGICLLFDPTKPHTSGSTVPIKLQLCDADQRNVSAAGIVVHVENVDGRPANDAGKANAGGDFRYDPELGRSGGYIFNLKTTGLASGTHVLTFTVANDPVPHQIAFQVR